jgi:hypothetical protein
MKKVVSVLLLAFVLGGVGLFFSGCGSSEEKVSGGNGLPNGWRYDINRVEDSVMKVGQPITLYVVVRDSNRNIVPEEELTVSLSNGIWSVEPADAGEFSDLRGQSTTFTPKKAYGPEKWWIYFKVNGKGNGFSTTIVE